ncbi:MAG TPA: hypothetical protein VHG28_17010 [Longimicrobiaceae bacterium]|nr:hypothetical protein [Longimicrobiaceae bacterium]
MSDPTQQTPPSPEALRRLYTVLDQLLRRMTRRLHGSPREMQMDAGSAINLLYDVRIPNREYVASTLSALIRELGQRRPDLFRYITFVEGTLVTLDQMLQSTPEEGGPGGAPPPGG